MMADTDEIVRIVESMRAKRLPYDSLWETIRKLFADRARGLDTGDPNLEYPYYFSVHAALCAQKLAAAHSAYITPPNREWFSMGPPSDATPQKAETKAFYTRAGQQAAKKLASSNFYAAMQEVYMDRVLFGTGCCHIDTTLNGRLVFRHVPCGQFAIEANDEGSIDTLARWFTVTPNQAVELFGLDAIPNCIRQAYETAETRYSSSYEIVHFVRPRRGEVSMLYPSPAEERPYEEYYLYPPGKNVVSQNGLYEFPYFVTRFLPWGTSPYGYPPGKVAIPVIRQEIENEKNMDALGRTAAFPRILELADQVGEVDLRAGGRTVVSPEAASLGFPREWATQGRYDVGLDRIAAKRKDIETAFYVNMIQLFTDNDKSMTATEANNLESERMIVFSPSFTLFISDMEPAMRRIVSLLWRAGEIDSRAPGAAVVAEADAAGNPTGRAALVPPVFEYRGVISQAIERAQQRNLYAAVGQLAQLAQLTEDPSYLDELDPTRTAAYICDSSSMPADCRATEQEKKQKRQTREQAAQAQMLSAMQQQQSAANLNNARAQQVAQQ